MEEHLQMVEDCIARESRLSDWERGFVDQMAGLLYSDVSLSPGRAAKLEEIWDKATQAG